MSPRHVFLAVSGNTYEGETVLSVHTTLSQAKKAVNEEAKRNFNEHRPIDTDWSIITKNKVWYRWYANGQDYLGVVKHKLNY